MHNSVVCRGPGSFLAKQSSPQGRGIESLSLSFAFRKFCLLLVCYLSFLPRLYVSSIAHYMVVRADQEMKQAEQRNRL